MMYLGFGWLVVCTETESWFEFGCRYQLYYTSGTSGLPKAVLLSNKIVVSHAVGTIKGESIDLKVPGSNPNLLIQVHGPHL